MLKHLHSFHFILLHAHRGKKYLRLIRFVSRLNFLRNYLRITIENSWTKFNRNFVTSNSQITRPTSSIFNHSFNKIVEIETMEIVIEKTDCATPITSTIKQTPVRSVIQRYQIVGVSSQTLALWGNRATETQQIHVKTISFLLYDDKIIHQNTMVI